MSTSLSVASNSPFGIGRVTGCCIAFGHPGRVLCSPGCHACRCLRRWQRLARLNGTFMRPHAVGRKRITGEFHRRPNISTVSPVPRGGCSPICGVHPPNGRANNAPVHSENLVRANSRDQWRGWPAKRRTRSRHFAQETFARSLVGRASAHAAQGICTHETVVVAFGANATDPVRLPACSDGAVRRLGGWR